MATQQAETPETPNKNLAITPALSKIKSFLPFSVGQDKSGRICIIFLVAGITALVVSVLLSSQIIALVGLGLTFWGILFNLVTPVRYVEGSLLSITTISTYLTIDRIINDCKYKGKAYYLPPYSHEEYLPEHLIGLKETVVFISENKDETMPPIEDIAQKKFVLTNMKGILIAPPGIGLLIKIEKEMPLTTKMALNDIFEAIPKIMTGNFGLAKEMTISVKTNIVNLTIHGSLYANLYNLPSSLKSINLLGCPIVSAIGCIIAKHTGRPVTVQNIKTTPENLATEIEYQIIQG